MSDVVAPSFFPTPVEIAGGLRWVRAHPVVATAAAAAAATAVSVFSFLQARADDSDEELLAHMEQLQLEQRAVEGDEDDEEDEEEEDAGDERRDAVRALRPRRSRPWAHRERLPGALDCAFVGKALAEDVYSSTDSDASSSPTRARDTSVRALRRRFILYT